MISLKFLDGVLHQSIQMTPGGQWTDYHPVPNDWTIKQPCQCYSTIPNGVISVIFKDNKTLCSDCHRDILADRGCKKPEKSLEEKFRIYWKERWGGVINSSIVSEALKDISEIAEQHFKQQGTLNSNITGEVA